MTIQIDIAQNGCRGCRMCVEVCPTSALAFDDKTFKASVKDASSCIGCLSCAYLCPSGALKHGNVHAVKNFYRDLNFSKRIRRFL
ncbi:MAG TPA: 4Fe-4S binding protein [Nitrospirota bacterium]|nr:4Fe-4S binding protein [Nitrospirota bacterium]